MLNFEHLYYLSVVCWY